MLLPHNAMVVVADGAHLKLFRNMGREGELALEEIDAPHLHAGAPSSGGHHISNSANPDSHTSGEDAFAAAVVSWLSTEQIAGRIESLFIIAAPRLLGELRRHYSHSLSATLAGELSKELVKHPVSDIEAAILKAR
jgi:protein required for attachment to host cells